MSCRTSAPIAVALACFIGSALAAAPAAAQGASVENATDAQKKAAQDNFGKGMAAQKKGRHDEALTAFKASYDAVASPNSHLMVARALVELGRLEEAYVEYEKTVAEAEAAAASDKKYAQTAKASKTELADLRSKIALLTINVTGSQEGDRVTVRGRELDQSQWGKPIPVAPGSVRVELQTSAGQESVQEVDAEAGGSPSVSLARPAAGAATDDSEGMKSEGSAEAKVDTGGSSMRTWAYVAGGVGVAGLAVFGVFGLMNNSKHGKLEDECTNNVCSKDLEEDADQGKTYQTIANVGLGVGIVGLAAGTVLFILSGNEEKTARHKAPPAPRVDVGVGPRWVSVHGSF